jgi:hypothetical protein
MFISLNAVVYAIVVVPTLKEIMTPKAIPNRQRTVLTFL